MLFTSTYFKKDDEELITFKSESNGTTVDFILMKKKALRSVKGVKVISCKECFLQHRLLVADINKKEGGKERL